MKEVKVSVIMPFHNGVEYMGKTMAQVRRQTLKEIEIICVDDESTDDTLVHLREYEKEDERITVLTQTKSNAGVARNLGMQKANGKYLLFLDSDDLFEENMLEKMYTACEESQADVCVCNADHYDTVQNIFIDRPQFLRKKFLPDQIPFSRKTMGKYILYFTTSNPWNKMVKKSFLEQQGILFQDIARANDQYFSVMVLLLAERITVLRDKLVHYRVKQADSLTAQFSKTPLCAYESMLAVKEKLDEMRLLDEPDVRCAFENKILNLMIYSLNVQNTKEGYQTLYNTLKEDGFSRLGITLREEDYYFNSLEYRNLRYMMECSFDEYLFVKNREYRDTINRKNIQYKDMVKQRDAKDKQVKQKEKEIQRIKETKRYQMAEKMAHVYYKICRKQGTVKKENKPAGRDSAVPGDGEK